MLLSQLLQMLEPSRFGQLVAEINTEPQNKMFPEANPNQVPRSVQEQGPYKPRAVRK